tara:strand:- start:168 stop:389 length:222 start_codon:yes stop_codon:yes gene_type:complete
MTTLINIKDVQKRPTISINNNFEVLSLVVNNTYYEAFTMDRLKEKLKLDNIELVKVDIDLSNLDMNYIENDNL